jgi:predicted enzyme related to lactoylglutathione lyase
MGNTVCWTDIPVTDLERANKFYSAVLGTPLKKESFPGMEFVLLPHPENSVSGCLVVMKDNQPSATGPLVYLSVEGRIDAAIAAVKQGGGKIIADKSPIGPYGFRAIFLDTEGNRMALHSQKA